MNHLVTDVDCFVVRWNIIPERKEEFFKVWDSIIGTYIDHVSLISRFAFFGWSRDPNVFVTIECYRDKEELAQLRGSDVFKELVAKMIDCCDGPVMYEQFSGVEADRSFFDSHPPGVSQVHPKGEHNHVKVL